MTPYKRKHTIPIIASLLSMLPCLGIAAESPGQVTLLSPLESVTTASPKFEWEDEGTSTRYRLQVYDKANLSVVHIQNHNTSDICIAGVCSVVPSVTLGVSDSHYWRVRGNNAEGWGAFTSKEIFSYEPPTNRPGLATLTSPLDSVDTATPTFVWEDEGTSTRYRLQVYDGASSNVVHLQNHNTVDICSAGVCSVTPSLTLGFSDNHYWRLRGHNTLGWGSFTAKAVFSFAEPISRPGLVTLTSPLDSVDTASPIFIWQDEGTSTRYRLQVYDSTTSGFVHVNNYNTADICSAGVCSVTPGVTLGVSDGHYWRVRGNNTAGWGAFTAKEVFSYSQAVTTATLSYPFAQTLDSSEQWFIWNKVNEASAYWLTVSDGDGTKYHFDYVELNANLVDTDQVLVSGLPTDGRIITTELITIINGSWDRRTFDTFTSSSASAGELSDGFDWNVAAGYSEDGALVDKQWSEYDQNNVYTGADYARAIQYALLWEDAYDGLDSQDNPFQDFEFFLNNYTSGKKVKVSLETTSKCNVPASLVDDFRYYAGNSIAFWDDAYLVELERLVSAFGAIYADDPRVIGVYVGIADGEYKENGNLIDECPASDVSVGRDGWGEMNMSEEELRSAQDDAGFDVDKFWGGATAIIDIYANAFPGNEHKLAYMNTKKFVFDEDNSSTDDTWVSSADIVQYNDMHLNITNHALYGRSLGNRDGLVENWMGYTEKVYGMTFTPAGGDNSSCNMGMDENLANLYAGRYWGTENEEYGPDPAWLERYGPQADQPYRFMISSLRMLQMRRNYATILSEGMNLDAFEQSPYNTASFLDYLARTIGRTKWNTADAFVVHGERYVRLDNLVDYDDIDACSDGINHARIREFGRWLTEIEGGGSPSMPVDLSSHTYMNSMTWGLTPYPAGEYPASMEGVDRYEYEARYHNSFTYDINDVVVDARCNANCAAEVKFVFNDTVATTLSVENQQGVLSTVQTQGEGGIKTATFSVTAQFNNGIGGGDFSVTSSEKVPVLLTRINFLD